ncbi:FeoB small GTPase domain-containing protein [Carboxydothermus hydrogenoformans]|uniref:FeoB small GTPase domain-containing protein n=1 Tax=Carboxydothermus hydrogenoformans TaxID=129958 RepID=UPI0003192BA0|nr:FeoB small GTPase domain-containing protein [Carboxydothermus hydrogenoformans]
MDCHNCNRSCHHAGGRHRRRFGLFWQKARKEMCEEKLLKIALVGSPNVGKSMLFNALTGAYVTVSNYPGTTVEVARGRTVIHGQEYEVIDTPGMYSLLPITEEEKVARDLLLEEKPDIVVHVVDAKNLGRMLPLTYQLIEAGLPVLLAINMMDEAEQLGLVIDREKIERELGIPVVTMAAAQNVGIRELKERVAEYVNK